MLRMYIATLSTTISNKTTARAVDVIEPSNSGLKLPRRPARMVERRMYVTNAMTGMYMSGEFKSSRGGRKMDVYWAWPAGPPAEVVGAFNRACWRDQGLCRHGNRTSRSLERT